ncbi:MAG: 50S ribosomal protein L14 [Candidatus Nasuia deltocephalinicola]
MIQTETILKVCDNSGAKFVKCIKIMGSSKKRYAYIGDLLKVSIKKLSLNSKLKKGDVFNAILIRSVFGFKRSNGFLFNFKENSVLLLNNKMEIIGSRIFGPVIKELKDNIFISSKINSLSPYYI